MTLGKYLNTVLDQKALETPESTKFMVCFCCGKDATVEVHGFSKSGIFFCDSHAGAYRKIGKSYRELEVQVSS
jgi:hypothetical protein